MEMRAIYEDILQQAIHSINGLQRRIGRVVWYRLVTFAMIAGATYLSITYAVWFSIVMFSCVVLFLFFVKQANELNEQKRQTEALAAACRRELKALQGELQAVVVNDIPAVHPYIHDLDVFGDQSLFSLINRSADEIGIPWLRDELLHLKASQKHANRRQAEVEILSEMHLVRLQIQAASAQLRISREELEDFTLWAEAEVHHPQWTWMVRLAPWYALPGFLLAVFGVLPSSLILAYFSVPLVVVGSQLKHTAKMAAALSGREKTMKHLAHLFRHAHGVDEKSGGKIQSARTLQDASEAFRNLARIASNTDQRSNIFAALLTNALFLAEIRNAHQANTWRQKHGHAVSGWFKALGELQGIASMGGFRANFRKQTCYPILTAQKEIQLAQAFHPLMLTGAAVANDISLNADQRVLLLTGANMAGKSTYLRVAGLHLVLASIGSCIPASSGAIGALDLFTSMRTTDSVQAGKSYFYAELERLVRLLEAVNNNPNTLVLLDEILKGTNSSDKEAGSRAFVKKLIGKHVLTMVATHDTSLCSLEDEFHREVKNAHFASAVGQGDLVFDYTLRAGVCTSMNATWLMTSMGIIDND